jgi:hypothetical protein
MREVVQKEQQNGQPLVDRTFAQSQRVFRRE